MSDGEQTMIDLGIKSSNAQDEVDPELDLKCALFCDKYTVLLRMIDGDEVLKKWCRKFSVYSSSDEHSSLRRAIYGDFMQQAYEDGIVISDYSKVIDSGRLDMELVMHPTAEWVSSLTKKQIIACIAKHFRDDHFCEGSLMNYSVAEGNLLVLLQGYNDKREE